MTRKNRHRGFCADPENDGVGFNQDHEPQCSPTYSGPFAFSEPESKAIRDAMSQGEPIMYLLILSH